MKNRIKLTSPALKSRAQAEEVLRAITEITISRNQAQLDMDAQITSIREQYEQVLSEAKQELEEKTELLRAWADAHPEEFRGLKSLELVHGVLGWRTGQPALKTCSGFTWDRVLEKLKADHIWASYIRVKEDVNKQAILGDRENFTPDMLKRIGLRVIQDESFFVEPNLTETENRQEATSK